MFDLIEPPAPEAEPTKQPMWRRVLREAAAFIKERGLCNGDFEDSQGRLCLHGAIQLAAMGAAHPDWKSGVGWVFSDTAAQAHHAIAAYLVRQGLDYGDGIDLECEIANEGGWAAGWSNEMARQGQAEQVIAALRAAADEELDD